MDKLIKPYLVYVDFKLLKYFILKLIFFLSFAHLLNKKHCF